MNHEKFEVAGSLRPDLNATEAYIVHNKSVTLSWQEVAEAICLLKHKEGMKGDKCIGYRISEKGMTFLFRE